ncbi:hypothetical protein PHLCEN_2v7954 [Hermanssonia centrifuga]|uniref:Proteasome assembly chaperone 3 n=1 Tax=Hermanssonia centrifuga TaxID=98765 RepID=A0A2R6NV40_9APHY|nr:hypothetical protein PHLCEN_2v7954 [Hermanssonia centrifuga]
MSPTEPLLPAGPADADVPSLPPPPPSIQLTPLLGNAQSDHMQTLHSLYASQVATLVWTSEAEGSIDSDRRGVIVGIALQNVAEKGHEGGLSEHERGVFHGVMAMVKDLLARS